MNTPMPPMEPLDANERELARILRALPAGEPSPALDARILRSASNAAAATRRPGARLLASVGAMWGIGSAAAAVLALGVVWQMRYGAPDRAVEASAPRAQAVSDVAEDDAVAVDLGQGRADAPAAPPPPPPELAKTMPAESLPQARLRMPARQAAPASAPPPAAAPEPFAMDQLDEHVAREAAANSAAAGALQRAEEKESDDSRDYAAAKAAAAPAPVQATASASASALGAAADTETRAEAGADALGGLAAQRAAAPMKPGTWLAEVRRLRDAGKIAEARAKLIEFHRAYPKWVVPTDLAPLLSE